LLAHNIKQFKLVLYLVTVITGIAQFILSNTATDFFSTTLLLVANLILIRYCYNEKYFFSYPISLNIVFISCIFSYSGALYYNSIELSHVNNYLTMPKEVISYLSYFWLVIIFSHIIYRKSHFCTNLKKKLTNFFYNLNTMNSTDYRFLVFLTIIGYGSVLYSVAQPIVSAEEGYTIITDIFKSMTIFIMTPIIIFFAKDFYNDDKDFPRIKILLFSLAITFFVSLTTLGRGTFFHMLFTFFISGIDAISKLVIPLSITVFNIS